MVFNNLNFVLSMQEIFKQLERNLDLCLGKDRFHLRKRLSRLRAEMRGSPTETDKLRALKDLMSQSAAQRRLRADRVPAFDYPGELPVAEKKMRFSKAFAITRSS